MRLSFLRWGLLALGLVAAGDVSAEAPAYGYGAAGRPTFDLRRTARPDAAVLADDEDDAEITDEAEEEVADAAAPAQVQRAAPERGTLTAVRDDTLDGISGAHGSFPVPSVVDVSRGGRSTLVRIERRGGDGRLALSPRAAEALGLRPGEEARVEVRFMNAAPGAEPRQTAIAANESSGPASLLPPGSEPPPPSTPLPAREPASQTLPSRVWAPPPAYVAPPRAYARQGGYMVQIGAFAELENAHRARAQVLSQGEVVVEPRRVGGAELYRVRVGPWPDRARAELARRQVVALGFPDAIIAPR